MVNHPCKQLMDTILNDKNFNLQAFVKSGLGELINQLVSYFGQFNKKQEASSFFKRAKFVNYKKVLESLKKIFGSPNLTRLDGDQNFMKNLNSIFCTMLHPESPNECRVGALDVFLIMIVLIPQKDLQYFQKSLSMMIPYAIVARGSDIADFKAKIYSDISPIYSEKGVPSTVEEARQSLQCTLTFVYKNWSTQAQLVQLILMNHILKVIYRVSIEKAGVSTQDYGFSYIPDTFHEEIILFVQKLLNSEMDVSPLFANRDAITATFAISEATTTQAVIGGLCTSLVLISTVYSTPAYYNACYSAKDFNKNTGKLILNILATNCKQDGSMEQAIIAASYEPIRRYLETVLQEFNLSQSYLKSVFQIYDENHGVFAHVIICTLRHLVVTNEKRPEVWDFFIKEFCSRKIGSAACAYFLQYLAIYGFPQLFSVDVDVAKQVSNQFISRNKRNRQESEYDFMAEHLEMILDTPHDFTRRILKQEFSDYAEFNEVLGNMYIQPLDSIPDKILNIINNILSYFTFYNIQDNQNSLYTFIPLYTLTKTLTKLILFPPGIILDTKIPYQISGNYLFKAIFDQPYATIRTLAFEVLARVLNLKEIQEYLGEKNLSSWYAALLLQMVNENAQTRQAAFKEAQSTIQDAFTGSIYLLPLMMALIEGGHVPKNQCAMSVLSSFPLFSTTTKLSSKFLDGIISVIKKDSSQFLKNAIDLLNKSGQNLRKRAIDVLEGISSELITKKEQSNDRYEFLLPAYSALIADELSNTKNADMKVVKIVFNRFTDFLALNRTEAIMSIRATNMYLQHVMDAAPDIVRDYITKISEVCTIITPSDSEDWAYQLIRLTTDLYVETGRVMKLGQAYSNFAVFLRNGIMKESGFSQDVKDIMMNSLELLSKNYLRYPSPIGTNFITHLSPINNPRPFDQIFRCQNTVKKSTTKMESVEITTQFPSGQFIWEFTPIKQSIVDDLPETKVTGKLMDKIPNDIKVPFEFEKQNKFSSTVNKIVDTLTGDGFDMIPDTPEFTYALDEINQIADEFIMRDPLTLAYKSRRPMEINTNTTAAVLQATHLLAPDNFDKSKLLVNDARSADFIHKAASHATRLGTKFGVIYVKDSNADQNEIMWTTYPETSPHFQEFITGLGWPVNLQKHPGYLGGLDAKNEKNGRTSIYYSDFMHEMMFHVGPLLPNDPNDKQQIYKKRHIGNDHIHICWVDSKKDYNTTTISSQFNQGHIIINPLQNGLFGIKIKWRDDVPWFGPLRCDVIVNKLALPSIVRETAEGAMLSIYQQQSKFSNPLTDIKKYMDSVPEVTSEKGSRKEVPSYLIFTTLLSGEKKDN